MIRRIAAFTLFAALSGCSVADLGTADRMTRGLVVILPGIEGRSALNVGIARNLDAGGVKCGIEIFDWNAPTPFMPLVNLTAYDRNREQAQRLARRIRRYQSRYPKRSVHLVGHSAGGGVALMALEAIPRGQSVTAAVLLGPAVSPEFPLNRALQRTEIGIFNFYSTSDVLFLELGTGLAGTVDREHGAAAGAVGFARPASPTSRELYAKKLFQFKWTAELFGDIGLTGGHFDWTGEGFAREHLAALVLQQQRGNWPSGTWKTLIDRRNRPARKGRRKRRADRI